MNAPNLVRPMPNRELALKKYREGYARLAYDGALYQETDFRRLYVGKLALKSGEVVEIGRSRSRRGMWVGLVFFDPRRRSGSQGQHNWN